MVKSIKIFFLTLIISSLHSCIGQSKTALKIINCSNNTIDSIQVWNVIQNKEEKLYSLKINDTIRKELNFNYFTLPRGENVVFGLIVFHKNFYFDETAGFIGFPGSTIDANYSFYIYDDGVTLEKDYVQKNPDIKHPYSELIY